VSRRRSPNGRREKPLQGAWRRPVQRAPPGAVFLPRAPHRAVPTALMPKQWTADDELRLMLGVCKGLAALRGTHRSFTEKEQRRIANEILDHLRLSNYSVTPGRSRSQHAQLIPPASPPATTNKKTTQTAGQSVAVARSGTIGSIGRRCCLGDDCGTRRYPIDSELQKPRFPLMKNVRNPSQPKLKQWRASLIQHGIERLGRRGG